MNKLVCIKIPPNYVTELIVGKVYNMIKPGGTLPYFGGNGVFYIRDEVGYSILATDKEYFLPLEEYRQQKLDSILNG